MGKPSRPGQPVDSRGQLLQNRASLERANASIANTQRLADESEQMGTETLGQLHEQRETIVRLIDTTDGIDANLSRANKILNQMTVRIMAHKCIMICIVLGLCGILGLEVYFRFFHH